MDVGNGELERVVGRSRQDGGAERSGDEGR
jgi:hypothetical protein